MVFRASFNNIAVISWRSVLLVEKTTDLSQVTDKRYSHNVVSSTPRHEQDSNFGVIDTDCTSSCKYNYHTTTTLKFVSSIPGCGEMYYTNVYLTVLSSISDIL